MSFTVRLTGRAIDDLRRLDSKVAQRAVEKLRWLGANFEAVQPEALSAERQPLRAVQASPRQLPRRLLQSVASRRNSSFEPSGTGARSTS